MRFDCRQLNDIVSFWPNNDTLFIATACSDTYIRIFNVKEILLVASIKGISGTPLCLDVNKDQSLLIAGYEDDSFIIYGIRFNFTAICRGVGHHSFIS